MEQGQVSWLATVVRSLQEAKGKWRAISSATGIPYDTLTKVALGRVGDPRVSTVQALHDYFASRPGQPTPADSARASGSHSTSA
ncbi:hypothetical protein DLM46_16615 [Paraburkholderia lacunae]|uniref:Transcriptional regulator n=1 Tax=Paraburkholderia lacunae TaxID=2211104 RepID=A0A370N789_9BURK|nr:hypothetical protein DLM46_16615 [Paraburkholderia lacunae]